jgi:hypothetical protein
MKQTDHVLWAQVGESLQLAAVIRLQDDNHATAAAITASSSTPLLHAKQAMATTHAWNCTAQSMRTSEHSPLQPCDAPEGCNSPCLRCIHYQPAAPGEAAAQEGLKVDSDALTYQGHHTTGIGNCSSALSCPTAHILVHGPWRHQPVETRINSFVQSTHMLKCC